MVEATGLKVRRRGHLQWHDLRVKFHKLDTGSKVVRGTQTGGQNRDLVRLTFLFMESRLT